MRLVRGIVAAALAFATVAQSDAMTGAAPRDAVMADAVTAVAAASGDRYWTVTARGVVAARGNAAHFGDMSGRPLNGQVVGMFATASGNGYWMLGADGGIFSFGDARFYGSTGGLRLNERVVGMAPTPTGNGYWLVAADGGIFAFGDARFAGSTASLRLNQPIIGMVAASGGYLLVARDGGVFAFGGAPFAGSMSTVPGFTAAGLAPVAGGYALVGVDGATWLLTGGPPRLIAPAPGAPGSPYGAAATDGWGTLAWRDDFTGAGLDRARWYPNRWFADTCSFGANPNTEVQSYWADNVTQPGDGTLRLTAKREARPCAENSWSGTKPFTSGWVQTGGANADADHAPGVTCAGDCYWEVSFRMSPGHLLFPAVWLMPVNGGSYPSRPEIDAVEFSKDWSRWSQHIHFDCADDGLPSAFRGADVTDGNWHRIGIAVEPGRRIRWYVDGVVSWTYTGCGIPSAAQQMYLILNVAVGGSAAVPPAGEPFPKEMLVDSVSLWRR